MKRVAYCSYGIKKGEFPKIKFFSNKQGRELNVSAINKDQYLEASKLLYEQEQFDDALLINIMWSFASRPSEILTLRFEDFENKDNQNLSSIMQTRRIGEKSLQYRMNFITR